MLGVGLRAELGSGVGSVLTAWPVGKRRDRMAHFGIREEPESM